MKFTFDDFNNLEDVEFYLCNPDGRELCSLIAYDRNVTLRFNDLSILEFSVPYVVSDLSGNTFKAEYYDLVATKRLVFATQIGWFQITSVDEIDDGSEKHKSIVAESLQTVFKNRGFTIHERTYSVFNPHLPYDTGFDVSKAEEETVIPTVVGQMYQQLGIDIADFCAVYSMAVLDMKSGNGLRQSTISRLKDLYPEVGDPIITQNGWVTDMEALRVAYSNRLSTMRPYDNWTVVYVSEDLLADGGISGEYRFFNEESTYGYSWMTQKAPEAFGAVVLFDFYNKEIQIKTIEDATPKSDLCLSFDNFMNSISVDESADDITTVLSCSGNGVDIRFVNPTGTNYLADFSYYTNKDWMSDNLINCIDDWKREVDESLDNYANLTSSLWNHYEERERLKARAELISIENNSLLEARKKVSQGVVDGATNDNLAKSSITAEFVEIGGRSRENDAMNTSPFYDHDFVSNIDFSGNSLFGNILFYDSAPIFENGGWAWPRGENGALAVNSMSGTAEEAYQKGFYFFFDTFYHVSYCKLEGKYSTVDASFRCSGFTRYVSYSNANIWIQRKQNEIASIDAQTLMLNLWIVTTEDQIKNINDSLNIRSYVLNHAGAAALCELDCYWFEGEYTNDNISLSDNATNTQTIELSRLLYDAGIVELSKVCQPRYSFSVSTCDFIKHKQFERQAAELSLGNVITVEKEDGVWYYPSLLEMSFSLEMNDSFTMTFANALRLDNWGYTYADLMTSSAAVSRQVASNWSKLISYSKDRDDLSSLAQNPLDSTLRAGLPNTVNQEFRVDDTGISGRKRIDEDGNFEPYQYRMSQNTITITDDGWDKNIRSALGKVPNPEWKNEGGSDTKRYLYGLIADSIVGDWTLKNGQVIKNAGGNMTISEDGIRVAKIDRLDDGSEKETILLSVNADTGIVQIGTDVTGGDVDVSGIISDINLLKQQIAELTYEPISITNFSHNAGNLVEEGLVVTFVGLTWNTSKEPSTMYLDDIELDDVAISAGGVNLNYQTITSDKTFILTAVGERGETDTAQTTIRFGHRIFYGTSNEPLEYDNSFIKKLSTRLTATNTSTVNVTANNGEYIYYCSPVSKGELSFYLDGLTFEGGMQNIATVAVDLDAYDDPVDYYVYRSDNAGLGYTPISIR